MPGVGSLGASELKAASQGSCTVLRTLGPSIQWVHSYVTADKIYCIYRAADEDMIREHARMAGFPANTISRVQTVISPMTAEGADAREPRSCLRERGHRHPPLAPV